MTRKSLRMNALAVVIGASLAGMAWQAPVQAEQLTAAPPAVANQAARSYIVVFEEPGLIQYRSGSQVTGTSESFGAASHERLAIGSTAANAYTAFLSQQRAWHVQQMAALLGRTPTVDNAYSITMNGMAITMTAAEAAQVGRLPGVKAVFPDRMLQPTTYTGPEFIGAGKVWDGSASPNHVSSRGEGIVVGVIDGGANSGHPSFANDASCGLSASRPKLRVFDCSSSNGTVCTGPNPEAPSGSGHGVHTASTAAGNTIDNTVYPAPNIPNGVTMSGVAPCAQIRSYKVCGASGCPTSQILSAIQMSIVDDVDVINFSISGGANPWNSYDIDRAFLDAVNSDIFIAAAAGNTGSNSNPVSRVNHIGPWITTVAASTRPELGPTLSIVGPATVPDELGNIALKPGGTTSAGATPTWSGKPIASYPVNITGCTVSGGIPVAAFTGSIAVLRRGDCNFTEKISNAYNAGAQMVVITNNQIGGLAMNTDGAPAVPAYAVESMTTGDALLQFLASHASTAIADTTPTGVGGDGDVLASFSLRGPTLNPYRDLTKPDVTAPGVHIYAATDPGSGSYQYMNGTSMASPHAAGAAVLVRAVHPSWSPTEVKSALMTTAKNSGLSDDGGTPWVPDEVGNGRIQVNKAVQAGFTLDETYARFLAANPNGGTLSMRELNLPSLRNLDCQQTCTFTRTIRNRMGTTGSWATSFAAESGGLQARVVPSSFTLVPGQSIQLTIKIWPPLNTTMPATGFGELWFMETGGRASEQHFAVAIRGIGGSDGPPPEDNPVTDPIFADGFDTSTEVPSTPIELKLDDGSSERAIGWSTGEGTARTEFNAIYLNRFSPEASNVPYRIDNVSIYWPDDPAIQGKSGDVLIYLDADADGDPTNATLVKKATFTITAYNQFQAIPVGLVISAAGDVYIGFRDSWASYPDGYHPGISPAALDTSSGSQQRSWLVAENGSEPNIYNLGVNSVMGVIGKDVGSSSLAGNLLIRASGETVSGQALDMR